MKINIRYSIIIPIFLLLFLMQLKSQTSFNSNSEQQVAEFLENVKKWRLNYQVTLYDEEIQPKCALSIAFDVIKYSQSLSEEKKDILKKLLQPPLRQKFRSSGNFTVYYDTSGYHTPSLLTPQYRRMLSDTNYVKTHEDSSRIVEQYVDSVLSIFNYVWEQFVDVYKFSPPPFEIGQNKYNIYITELGSGLYGQTVPIQDPINPGQNPPLYATYIEIDNDFISVYQSSRGIPGLKVTAAHELHHAIQLGSYGYREYDRYFFEITSTWAEDLLFDEINDYYQYIKTYQGSPRGHFATPDISFITTDGLIEYSRAIWGKFIQEKFSPIVMRNVWEILKSPLKYQIPSIFAMNEALIHQNSSLKLAFVEFAKWNYYTSNRTVESSYYKEAQYYPLIKTRTEIEIPSSGRYVQDSAETFSSVYLPIKYSNSTSALIVTNLNYDHVINAEKKKYNYTLHFSTTSGEKYKEIMPNLFVKLDVADLQNWTLSNLIQYQPYFAIVYPNPYIIGDGGEITFEFPSKNTDKVTLYIFNMEMSLVYKQNYYLSDNNHISWNAKNESGDYVSSGVYIFVIQTNSENISGKFAVINK